MSECRTAVTFLLSGLENRLLGARGAFFCSLGPGIPKCRTVVTFEVLGIQNV